MSALLMQGLPCCLSTIGCSAVAGGVTEAANCLVRLCCCCCRVPAYYALILRSLTVLEGLALQADPRYKLLGRAYPYIARRLLTDPAPELRASFEELILKVRATGGKVALAGLLSAVSTLHSNCTMHGGCLDF
jgi:hypothetical protein